MKKIVIVHGWGNNSGDNWFPYLKSRFKGSNIDVFIPDMPNTEHPTEEAWVAHLKNVIPNPNEDTIFVGHSLGGITILRYIEGLSESTKVGGILLVASFAQLIGYDELATFFEKPVDFDGIKKKISGGIVLVNSDNDTYVSNDVANLLRSNLRGEFHSIHNGGHLTTKDGYSQFPMLVEILEKMLK